MEVSFERKFLCNLFRFLWKFLGTLHGVNNMVCCLYKPNKKTNEKNRQRVIFFYRLNEVGATENVCKKQEKNNYFVEILTDPFLVYS